MNGQTKEVYVFENIQTQDYLPCDDSIKRAQSMLKICALLEHGLNYNPYKIILMYCLDLGIGILMMTFTVENYAAFFNCTPVGRASDSMMAPT